jgi:hypothetical protein
MCLKLNMEKLKYITVYNYIKKTFSVSILSNKSCRYILIHIDTTGLDVLLEQSWSNMTFGRVRLT